jgi:dsRNA-specific ribonuclease
LGDALFDSVLADYLFQINQDLTKGELDWWRQTIASRESLSEFAIELGLPRCCSSWNRPSRKSPEKEPRVWAEMFEAVVGVVFIDCGRDFLQLSSWLKERFIRSAIGAYVGDSAHNTRDTTADDLDVIG